MTRISAPRRRSRAEIKRRTRAKRVATDMATFIGGPNHGHCEPVGNYMVGDLQRIATMPQLRPRTMAPSAVISPASVKVWDYQLRRIHIIDEASGNRLPRLVWIPLGRSTLSELLTRI